MGRVFRMILNLILILLVVAVVGGLYQGLTAKPHLDPAAAPAPMTPNWIVAAPKGASTAAPAKLETPVWATDPAALLAALDKVALSEPRTEIVEAPEGAFGAGDPLAKTYVQRSATVGYPDYISVRAAPADGGASLILFSRSVYGISDRGVNAARLKRWIAAVDQSQK